MDRMVQVAAFCLIVFALGKLPEAAAAPVLFYQGAGTENFDMLDGESRETLFQALNDVTLDELGAFLDPTGTDTFTWRILNSDASFTLGSELFSTNVSYDDLGLMIYNTAVNVDLVGGNYYVLSLENTSGTVTEMRRIDEVGQGLPFDTTDGNFNIIDGGANGSAGNSILPAFSVGTAAAAVPEPSSMTLLATGVCGLAAYRRRRIKSVAA